MLQVLILHRRSRLKGDGKFVRHDERFNDCVMMNNSDKMSCFTVSSSELLIKKTTKSFRTNSFHPAAGGRGRTRAVVKLSSGVKAAFGGPG